MTGRTAHTIAPRQRVAPLTTIRSRLSVVSVAEKRIRHEQRSAYWMLALTVTLFIATTGLMLLI
jgi:hypothetical protein